LTILDLDYRFKPVAPSTPLPVTRQSNRRSLAKKKWWDEKRAREAKERGE
jgi:hypothetical protein